MKNDCVVPIMILAVGIFAFTLTIHSSIINSKNEVIKYMKETK